MEKEDGSNNNHIETSQIRNKDDYHHYVRILLERIKSAGNGNDPVLQKNALMNKNFNLDITEEE